MILCTLGLIKATKKTMNIGFGMYSMMFKIPFKTINFICKL